MEIACLVSVASRHPAPHPDPPRDHSSVVAQWQSIHLGLYLWPIRTAYVVRSRAHAHFLTCATSAKNAENIFHN